MSRLPRADVRTSSRWLPEPSSATASEAICGRRRTVTVHAVRTDFTLIGCHVAQTRAGDLRRLALGDRSDE